MDEMENEKLALMGEVCVESRSSRIVHTVSSDYVKIIWTVKTKPVLEANEG
jgi:hypothetical protein